MSVLRKRLKYLVFTFMPVLLLGVLAEVSLRVVYFQAHGEYPLALLQALRRVEQFFLLKQAERQIAAAMGELGVTAADLPESNQISARLEANVYDPQNHEVLAFLEGKYEAEFRKFLEDVNTVGAKLIVVYLPSSNVDAPTSEMTRNFFQHLAARHQLDLLDPSPVFRQYSANWVTLYPEDSHLSRFGNDLLVDLLGADLRRYQDYRSPVRFPQRPAMFGDLQAHTDSIWEMNRRLPFRTVTNRQGLRMDYELAFPKTKQRILALGDSYTFGVYLNNQDTYPSLLTQKFPDTEVINAGVCGYTITEEARLFRQKAKYVEPDIVLLQVFTNDLPELFFVSRRLKGERVEPAEVELRFLKQFARSR